MRDTRGRPLYMTIEFITFYGNNFKDYSIPGEHYEYYLNATSAIIIDDAISFAGVIKGQ